MRHFLPTGSPAQLIDRVRHGTADIVWSLPGYSAGRFPVIEVFELPFMMTSAEATSRAVWDFVQEHNQSEFRDVHPLAFHVHGPGHRFMVGKPVSLETSVGRVRVCVWRVVWQGATTRHGRSLQGGATQPGGALGVQAGR